MRADTRVDDINALTWPRRDPEPFDWYQRYSGIKDILAQHIKKEDAILMVGAGNSRA